MEDNEERLLNEQHFFNSDDWRENRKHLDKYRSIFTEKKGTIAYRNEIIERNINPNNTVMLDYGCGKSELLLNLSSKIKNGIGIDLSQKEIENVENQRKSKNIVNIKYCVMDAMNTEFYDKSFDVIHGEAILHHLDLEKSLRELKRILKDSGVGVFIEPLATNPLIELYRKLTPKLRTPDERPFGRREIKIIKDQFKKTKIKHFGFFTLFGVMFRNRKCFNKIVNILYIIDDIILADKSPLKYLAWVCVLEIRK